MQAPLVDGVLGEARPVRIPRTGPAVAVRYSPHAHWLAVEIAPSGTERTEIWLVSTDPADPSAVLLRDDTDTKTSLVEWDPREGGPGTLAVDAVRDDGLAEGRLVNPRDGSVTVIDRRVDGKLVAANAGHALMRSRDLITHREADVDEFCVSRDETTAAVLWNLSGCSALELLRLDVNQRVSVRRSVALPGLVAHGLRLTDDGSVLVLTVESPDAVPTVYLVDTRSGAATPVVGGGLRGEVAARLGVPELLHFTARDGVELSGWLYRAGGGADSGDGAGGVDRADGPVPMLEHFHGGPEGQSRPEHHDVLRAVIDAGVSVFTPNVRGSFGSGRAFLHADNRYGRFAGIQDLADSASFLVDAGLADPARLAVSGRSYGGYLVNVAVTWFPDLFRAAVCACGMSDLETFYRDTEPWIASAAYPKYGYPIQDGELLRSVSPLVRLSGMPTSGEGTARTPVLFVHGMHDTNVPPSEYLQMRDALDARGVPTSALELEDEGHVFVRAVNRRRIADAMVDWLRRFGVC